MKLVIFHIFCALILGVKLQNNDSQDITIPTEAFGDMSYLISKAGYPCETYTVKTQDGYLLQLSRIPYGKAQNTNQNRPVVLLLHGLFSGSQDWILIGPGKASAYFFADNGYDVWMGNCRGNYYSRKHVFLNPDKDHGFWNFTLHEMGFYDIPAMIDKVLEISKATKLHYVGHSQGCTTFFIMASTRKEYRNKILSMNAYAPGVYFSGAKIQTVGLIRNNFIFLYNMTYFLLHEPMELYPRTLKRAEFAYKFCQKSNFTFEICNKYNYINYLGPTDGYDPDLIPLMLSVNPSGSSSNQYVHFFQLQKSGSFHQFDYGFNANKLIYGEPEPPKYDLGAIDTPVSIWYGKTDIFFNQNDMARLFKELGNGISNNVVKSEKFNHADFLYSYKAMSVLYKPTLEMMNKYN